MKFTKKQFRELLLILLAGTWVRSAVMESRGEDFKKVEEWNDYFALMAKQLGYDDLVDIFKGIITPSNDICLENEEEMEEFMDEIFWEELEVRLGKRDFYESVSKKDLSEMDKNPWLPDRIDSFYRKYEKEFTKFGIGRLRIIPKK
jgi:hypothetical protein